MLGESTGCAATPTDAAGCAASRAAERGCAATQTAATGTAARTPGAMLLEEALAPTRLTAPAEQTYQDLYTGCLGQLNLNKQVPCWSNAARVLVDGITQIKESSGFFKQVSEFVPNNEEQCPQVLLRMARMCGGLSFFLSHLATAVHGISSMGRLIGGTIQRIVHDYGLGLVPEPEEEERTLVVVSTLEEVMDVLMSWRAGAAVRIDVGAEANISLAIEVYELLRMQGPNAVELVRDARHLNIKRMQHSRAQGLLARHHLPRSWVHDSREAHGLATLLPNQ